MRRPANLAKKVDQTFETPLPTLSTARSVGRQRVAHRAEIARASFHTTPARPRGQRPGGRGGRCVFLGPSGAERFRLTAETTATRRSGRSGGTTWRGPRGSGDGRSPPRRNDKPGSTARRSLEDVEEAGNPTRGRCTSSEGHHSAGTEQLRRSGRRLPSGGRRARPREKETSPRGGAVRPRRGSGTADEVDPALHVLARAHPVSRAAVLGVAHHAFGRRGAHGPRGPGGSRLPGSMEVSRGAKAQERNGRWRGATRVGANGLGAGGKLRSR